MVTDTPLLSIIIPMYNTEAYIDRCLRSVLSLEIPVEVIVVDDGSTDRSSELVHRYHDVHLLTQENAGVSEARNHGLAEARGDFIAFVDSDDLILPEGYEQLYHAFRDSSADMAMGGIKLTRLDGGVEYRRADENMRNMSWEGQACFAQLLRTNTFTPLVFCYMFRRSFLVRMGYRFRHRMSEDDLWTSIAMCEAKKIMISDALHYNYCKREDSIMGMNEQTLFRAENHVAVAHDLYLFMNNHERSNESRDWLACKILYIAVIAYETYAHLGTSSIPFREEMYREIISIVLNSEERHVQRAGRLFSMRLVAALKREPQ